MFVAKPMSGPVEVVELEQSEGDVFVRVDGLVALACYAEGRRLVLNQKWLEERGYRVEIEN